MNPKKIYRLDKDLYMKLRNKVPRRRGKAKVREDRRSATHTNDNWAMDFVQDRLVTGRKIRILTVISIFSRFSPATDPRCSYRGEDVVQILERICGQMGYPRSIRVDQGSEFISRDLDLRAYQKGIVLDFSCLNKNGGLASGLQRSPPTQCYRQQATDIAAEQFSGMLVG